MKKRKMTVKELMENYKKAVIIDMDKKQILIIKNESIKVYSRKQYQDYLDKFGMQEFED